MRALERRSHRPPPRLRLGLLVRRQPRIGAALTAIVAVLAGVGVASVVSSAEAERAAWGAQRPVVVVTRDLEPGTEVRSGDVTIEQRPSAAVPEGALADVPDGAVVHHAVFAGEELLPAHLAQAGSSGLAAAIDDRRRAIAIPVEAGTAPPLEVGQLVDLVAVVPDAEGQGSAFVVAADARVLAVDETAISVEVARADAARVASALATGVGVLTLVGTG